ncbi:MAG: FAD-binding oxidoreductase [Thermodesulfobacteriota bacterium]
MKNGMQIKTALKIAVGPDRFHENPDKLSEYAHGGAFVAGQTPLCAVEPKTTDQVAAVVRAAVETGANLIPCSSGSPRSQRGCRVPADIPSVVVDMGKMDRINRINRRNKVAIVEPGVRFGTLQAEAKKLGMKALLPLLPRASKSVVAAYLEREPITIPKYHWDMTDPMLCVETIFGTGDMFRTGGAAGPGSLEEQWKSGASQKNPMGPAQTDLVRVIQGAQGTMGIVTWSSVKLEVLPAIRKGYFVTSPRIETLIDLAYAMTQRRLGDELFLLNAQAMAGILEKDKAKIEGLAKKLPPWILFYCVAGYEIFPELRVRQQERDIAALANKLDLKTVPDLNGARGDSLARMLDEPSPEPWWKDRLKGAHAEVFFLTTMDGVPVFLEAMGELADAHGYPAEDMGVYVQPVQQGRNCHLEFMLPFDPKDADDKKRAQDLFDEAGKVMFEKGAFFSRPYGPWAELAYSRCPDTVAAIKTVKDILDPHHVFNQGRICL